jgi:hypothetical protein
MVPRYLAFVFVPPEMVAQSYRFKPMGIFSMENKIVKSAQVMDAIKVGSVQPGLMNIGAALQYVLEKLQGVPEAKAWFPPFPMLPGIPGGMPGMPGMLPPPTNPGEPPGQGSMAGVTPPNTIPGNRMQGRPTPGMKGGPNGNQPSFLPPNPIRRQPVTT